ncbi:hypothetical protein FY046_23370 [Erwinia sp. 1181_3]|uniref:hypothetical protein n=1 Tax=Erwinia sp. 1181_3 TaxID=2605957 RepID=UPI004058D55F
MIDNYEKLKWSNNIPKAAIATISLAIPVLSKAVAPAIGEWVGSQAVAQRLVGAGIAGAANTTSQIQNMLNDPKEQFNPASLFIATISAGVSTGMKIPGTVIVSTVGAGIDGMIDGKNPIPKMVGAAGGAFLGYYSGLGVEKITNAYLNPWKNGFKDSKNSIFPWITNPPKISPIPSQGGAAVGSYFSERAGKHFEEKTESAIK